MLPQHIDCLQHSVASGHYGIHEQHLAATDVVGKTCIDDACLVCIGIRFNQNLSNAYRAAAITQTLLHRFARTDNGDATVARAIFQTLVNCACGRLYVAIGVW